jgi:hypothetical protein
MAYVQLGAVDVAFSIMQQSLEKDEKAWVGQWDFASAWAAENRPLRVDPRFGELAERIGMVDYWKQYGYPDSCRAGSDSPIVCS